MPATFRTAQKQWQQQFEREFSRELTRELRRNLGTGRVGSHRRGGYGYMPRRHRRLHLTRKFGWWCWNHRKGLAPLYVALAAQVAGIVVSVAEGGARTVAVLGVLAAAGLWWWTSPRRATRSAERAHRRHAAGKEPGKLAKEWRRIERIYAGSVFLIVAAWLFATALVGAGPPMPGLLGLATLGAGVPWWWHHRIRPVPPVADQIAAWRDRVACDDGALPKSELVEVTPVTREDAS